MVSGWWWRRQQQTNQSNRSFLCLYSHQTFTTRNLKSCIICHSELNAKQHVGECLHLFAFTHNFEFSSRLEIKGCVSLRCCEDWLHNQQDKFKWSIWWSSFRCMKKLADLLVSPGFIRCDVICLPVDVHNSRIFGAFPSANVFNFMYISRILFVLVESYLYQNISFLLLYLFCLTLHFCFGSFLLHHPISPSIQIRSRCFNIHLKNFLTQFPQFPWKLWNYSVLQWRLGCFVYPYRGKINIRVTNS